MKDLIAHLETIITAIETWEAPTNSVAVVRNKLIEHLDEAGTLLRVLRDDGFTAGGETAKLEEEPYIDARWPTLPKEKPDATS